MHKEIEACSAELRVGQPGIRKISTCHPGRCRNDGQPEGQTNRLANCRRELINAVEKAGFPFYDIGCCHIPGQIAPSIAEAFAAACSIGRE